MKPMTIYTDNTGGTSGSADNITPTTDYLPLLGVTEVFGSASNINVYEKTKQRQYSYYIAGNSTIKYKHSNTSNSATWWLRSPSTYSSSRWARANAGGDGSCSTADTNFSYGIAPIFRV
jgi:hypothetical protein